jgi:hypothetical protein
VASSNPEKSLTNEFEILIRKSNLEDRNESGETPLIIGSLYTRKITHYLIFLFFFSASKSNEIARVELILNEINKKKS